MGSKSNSTLNSSATTVLLVILLVMVRRGASREFGASQSLGKSNELQTCESKLGAKCGDNIYQRIFEDGKEVSKECCGQLLTVGKDCHDLLTEVTIVYKRLSIKEAKEIWNKNDNVWKQCKGNEAVPILARSSELLNCENGLGKKCGHSIYENVFESGNGVSKECCSLLRAVGKDCHHLLTEVTIVYKHLTIEQGKEAWHKNDKVWEHCKAIEGVSV